MQKFLKPMAWHGWLSKPQPDGHHAHWMFILVTGDPLEKPRKKGASRLRNVRFLLQSRKKQHPPLFSPGVDGQTVDALLLDIVGG